MENIIIDEVVEFFHEGKTYEEISVILKSRYPGVRGFSVTTIKRFCKDNGLSPRMSQAHLNEIVADAVEEVAIHFLMLHFIAHCHSSPFYFFV